MIDVFVEVLLELDPRELVMGGNPERELLERMRDTADRRAREAGGELRTDRAPELLVRQATTLTGAPILLVASRWPARAPANVELARFGADGVGAGG